MTGHDDWCTKTASEPNLEAETHRSTTRPLNALICHCWSCQKAVGSAFNARMLFKDDDIELAGSIVYYNSSPSLARGHCDRCGPSVVVRVRSRQWTTVTAGTLDDPAQFEADAHVWVSEKQPWLALGDGLPTLEEMPPKGWRPQSKAVK